MASKYEKFITKIDESTGVVECLFCGHRWAVNAPNAHYGSRALRGAYLCPNGCTENYEEALEARRKMLFRVDPETKRKLPARGLMTKDRVKLLDELHKVIENLYQFSKQNPDSSMAVFLHQSISMWADDTSIERITKDISNFLNKKQTK